MPTRMSSRLASGMLVSEERVSSWLVRKKPIAATYPLSQVREAYQRLASGHILGKIVLIP